MTIAAETISHYRLLELLGRGAMGEVWLAEDRQLPRKVAIKLLPRHLGEDAEAVERLLREARTAASIDHPCVVAVYEGGMAEGRPYLVMQRIEGETLEQRLKQGALAVDEAVALAAAIADALSEVHAIGIVHRDLKPANIVLSARGPKILDFGVASVRGATRLTVAGAAVGTPATMSPEQVKGQAPDNRSDLWSLGVILYQSLTGKSPFQGDSLEALTYQVLHVHPPAPSKIRPEVGPDLDYTVLKLLRKEPANRYARAEEVLADLRSLGEAGLAPAVEEVERTKVPAVAVLYFEVLSSDPEDAFLAAGLTEDLIVDLSRVQGVRVAARAEVLPYRTRIVPPRTVARELGVDHVILGSVRRAGNRARISAQLVRGADGQAIWTERFDRTLDDIFEVQAEVSKRVADALQVALRPEEREMLSRSPTRNHEAYRLYLNARALVDDESSESLERAKALLQGALELDPEFALAHATLAEIYAVQAYKAIGDHGQAERALAEADEALAREPDLIEAHAAKAVVHFLRNEPEQLRAALARVIALNPDRPQELEWTAWAAIAGGQLEEGLGLVNDLIRRYPDRYRPYGFLQTCHQLLGHGEESRRAGERQLEHLMEYVPRHPDQPHPRSLLGVALAQAGEREAGMAQAERAADQAPEEGHVQYNYACTLAACGEKDRAVAQIVERFQPYVLKPTWAWRDPDLASLRDHPDFIRVFALKGGTKTP